jgi:hypothetical protein
MLCGCYPEMTSAVQMASGFWLIIVSRCAEASLFGKRYARPLSTLHVGLGASSTLPVLSLLQCRHRRVGSSECLGE